MDCLASPLTITPWPVIRNGRRHAALLGGFCAPAGCGRLVSGSFQTSSEALFSFHSRYYCAIGLGSYLRLEACASQIHARFPTHATQESWHCGACFRLRDFHPLWSMYSSSIQLTGSCRPRSCNSTSPTTLAAGFGLPCSVFDRLY